MITVNLDFTDLKTFQSPESPVLPILPKKFATRLRRVFFHILSSKIDGIMVDCRVRLNSKINFSAVCTANSQRKMRSSVGKSDDVQGSKHHYELVFPEIVMNWVCQPEFSQFQGRIVFKNCIRAYYTIKYACECIVLTTMVSVICILREILAR